MATLREAEVIEVLGLFEDNDGCIYIARVINGERVNLTSVDGDEDPAWFIYPYNKSLIDFLTDIANHKYQAYVACI